jgi:hypothetical protein
LIVIADGLTVSVKSCVGLVPTPFDAVIVILYAPPVPAPGVPERTPALDNVTVPGRVAPVSLKVGAG